MKMSLIGQNQTVSPVVYGIAVRQEANLPNDFIHANRHRIDRAYAAGEPIWMIADELRMIYQTRPVHKPMKSPRALASRIVRVGA
jgi:hypothetical protein